MPPRWLPVALLTLLWLADVPTLRNRAARLRASPQDAHSLQLNNLLGLLGFGMGLASAWLLPRSLPPWLAWSGVPIALAGAGLRLWSIVTLGELFTLTVQVRPDQGVIDRGPYRLVRHPSYAGADLSLIGIGLTCGSWWSAPLFVVPWLIAHVYRIRVEERAMLATLGERYARYSAHTWRLVPFIW
jgi:protein-S-isoprenylcysteine O-methyltransferase Ste14